MIEALFIVTMFVSVVAIYVRDQYRKTIERATVCRAIARALERTPAQHDAGASWLTGEIQKELVRAGWEPFP